MCWKKSKRPDTKMITMVISGSFLFVLFKNNEHAPFVINNYQECILFLVSLLVRCWLHRGLAVSDKSFTHCLLPQFSSSFLQVGRIPTSCSVFSRPHQMSRTVLTPQAPTGWLLIKVTALVICHGSLSAMWCVQHFAGYEDGTGPSCWVPEICSFFFFF